MIIDAYDTFYGIEEVRKALKPEIIIRFGSMPVSKAFDFLFKRKSSSYDKSLLMEIGVGEIHPCYPLKWFIVKNLTFVRRWKKERFKNRILLIVNKWISLNKKAKEVLTILNKQDALSEAKVILSVG